MTTSYGKDYFDESLKVVDSIQPEYIQKMAQMIFSKPSITVIETNKAAFEANKDFLATQGEVRIFDDKET